ncbi:hypothetical protein [Flavobacterium okayamense]|uniref:Nucleoside phosphorylase domain-containing protein n=1 Tax=Flavobacterium okayamense TaxID=2830782 RepID=A0ABM7S504_9FLAO|nr:hypothetical protein [Flavobacterium okayamense]BCY28486.1 hypothetical protein KK2020170_13540 [Flavobacterium okayamense]
MKINIITPMEIENEKVISAIERIQNKKHEYHLVTSEIGREATAKTMMYLPDSDVTILLGFAAIVGKESEMPYELRFGKPIEITTASLYGYEGGLFENGKPIRVQPKLNLPCLSSLTSDKFVRTTNLAEKTVVNMEDYTFMYLKRPQDFIVRVISDYLPHEVEIDFFEHVKNIDFLSAIEAIENNLI